MSFSCKKIQKARKEHRCECGAIIQKGQHYLRLAWLKEYVESSKHCRFCANLINRLWACIDYWEKDEVWKFAYECGIVGIVRDDDPKKWKYWCEFFDYGHFSKFDNDDFDKKVDEFNRNEQNDPFYLEVEE